MASARPRRYAPTPFRVASRGACGRLEQAWPAGRAPRLRGAGCRVGEGRLDLSAKFAPPAPAGLARSRLLDLAAHRVVLVLAPAGHGKTTLLGQIASRFAGTVVWYRIDAADRDPQQLAGRIGRALGRVGLAGAECRSFEDVAAALDAAGRDMLLVFDDFHAVAGSAGGARAGADDRAGALRRCAWCSARAGSSGSTCRPCGSTARCTSSTPTTCGSARGRSSGCSARSTTSRCRPRTPRRCRSAPRVGGRARDVPPAHRGPPTGAAAAGAGRPVPRVAAGALLPRPRGARRPARRAARVPAPHERARGADRHLVRRSARRRRQPGRARGAGAAPAVHDHTGRRPPVPLPPGAARPPRAGADRTPRAVRHARLVRPRRGAAARARARCRRRSAPTCAPRTGRRSSNCCSAAARRSSPGHWGRWRACCRTASWPPTRGCSSPGRGGSRPRARSPRRWRRSGSPMPPPRTASSPPAAWRRPAPRRCGCPTRTRWRAPGRRRSGRRPSAARARSCPRRSTCPVPRGGWPPGSWRCSPATWVRPWRCSARPPTTPTPTSAWSPPRPARSGS